VVVQVVEEWVKVVEQEEDTTLRYPTSYGVAAKQDVVQRSAVYGVE
jgi:hypothetical protein